MNPGAIAVFDGGHEVPRHVAVDDVQAVDGEEEGNQQREEGAAFHATSEDTKFLTAPTNRTQVSRSKRTSL